MTATVVVRGLGLDEEEHARLRAIAGDRLDLRFPDAGEPADLTTAIAVCGGLSDAELSLAGRLRWLHLWSAGADQALTPGLADRPEVTLTTSRGNGGVPLAEHALMLLLLLDRGAWRWARAQQDHEWHPLAHGELAGRTLGLIGLGNAGRHIARIARAMGMRVVAVRRTRTPSPDVDALYGPDELRKMLGESDAIVVTTPLTAETAGMLGEDEFRAMKPTAFYINVSRGAVADDAALRRALTDSWIAGAGLDAHPVEPLDPDDPLWDLPHVIITPHSGSHSPASRRRSFEAYADNLGRFARGEELSHIVERGVGY